MYEVCTVGKRILPVIGWLTTKDGGEKSLDELLISRRTSTFGLYPFHLLWFVYSKSCALIIWTISRKESFVCLVLNVHQFTVDRHITSTISFLSVFEYPTDQIGWTGKTLEVEYLGVLFVFHLFLYYESNLAPRYPLSQVKYCIGFGNDCLLVSCWNFWTHLPDKGGSHVTKSFYQSVRTVTMKW